MLLSTRTLKTIRRQIIIRTDTLSAIVRRHLAMGRFALRSRRACAGLQQGFSGQDKGLLHRQYIFIKTTLFYLSF